MPPMAPTTSIDTNVSNSSHPASLYSPRHVRSRTQSVSSDRPSTIAHSLMSPPLAVSPEASFMAGSAASQIVTNDHDTHSETWYDQVGIEPSGETALVSSGALQLANNFVDQLLFNIIGVARSTTLAALRPAVSEVLKPKLAKDAINQADEELKEYLGGGEIEELGQSPTKETSHGWDVELVWKRTRLRCMVYSSLGDMEEEDEDYYMEQEHLSGDADDQFERTVSPAVAIFLTSILEYMGEQVLVIASQAAFNRLRIQYEKELKEGMRQPGDVADRIVVEELDMERVALDRTLGRLWRSWKKRIRSPTEPNFARPFPRSGGHSRRGSAATDAHIAATTPIEDSAANTGINDSRDEEKLPPTPSAVPLPMSDNDVAEIEVPGLVSYSDDEDSDADTEDTAPQPPRPKSLIMTSLARHEPQTAEPLQSRTNAPMMRRRASSLPTAAAPPYRSPVTVQVSEPSSEQGEATAHEQPPNVATDTPAPTGLFVERQVNEDGVSPLDTEGIDYINEKSAEIEPSPISMIMSGAAAFGAAAAAGVAAMAQGSAFQTVPTPMEEEEIDDFTEEPEIMTSSRASFYGRSSPAISESSRPPPITLPARSNSVRSVRVIDVQPRTPSIKSRAGSVDFPDMPTRPASISREGSISTPPIAEEGATGDRLSTKAIKRNAVIVPSSEEQRDTKPSREHQPTSSYTPALVAPTSAPAPSTASAAPQNHYNAARSFLDLDTKPEVPERYPTQRQPSPLPTVPEKSTSRSGTAASATGRRVSPDRAQQPAPGSPASSKASRPKLNDSPSSSNSTKYKPMRSSEDGLSQRPQDVARNFEELLQNDQTIQYTLTPENMRDMDVSNRAPNNTTAAPHHKSRKSEDMRQTERPRSSSLQRSLSVTRSAGLNSHPSEYQANGKGHGKLTGPVPRAPPPVSMANYQKRSGAPTQARDARVPRESVADFADFIRATGPPGGKSSPTRPVPGSVAHGRRASGSVPQNTSIDSARPRQSTSNRIRLQARDAAVSASNESSDLIDFIRRGPPSTGNDHRIPRNVAPFRTTMDSDQLQMSGAGGGKAVDAVLPQEIRHSQASTAITERSLPSSINSQSALLNQAKKPTQYTNFDDDDDMMPKRKQRRVRDPYAIDFSDEEEDDFEDIPKPKPKKEESLIDFLNNYDPPGDSAPRQPFITSQPAHATPKKKASAPNLISRLRGSGAGSSATKTNGVTANQPRSVSSQVPKARGHVPLSAHMPSGAAAAAPIMNNQSLGYMAPASSGRVPMKKFEPRDASSSGVGRTSDLASFLRDSEPPPGAMAAPIARPEDKPSNGFFGRRKKSSVY